MVDPLTDLEIDVQSFDIPRLVTVYPDKAGMQVVDEGMVQ